MSLAGPRPRIRLTARGFERWASLEEPCERVECLQAPSRERAVVSLGPLLCLTPFSTWWCVLGGPAAPLSEVQMAL